MKFYSVRFAWFETVVATYEVEMPDDATPDQIVEAAEKAADDGGWSVARNTNCPLPTFVDEILAENNTQIAIPEEWSEKAIMRNAAP